MTFSVSPSVTVREIDATAVVPAVGVAPAAIAGVFAWGPMLERTLVSSEDQLVSRFGKPSDLNGETFFVAADYLAYSAALYVTRVDNGANTANSSTFRAKYPGAFGNNIGVSYVGANSYSTAITNDGVGNTAVNSTRFVVVGVDSEFLSTDAGTDDVVYKVSEDDVLRVGNHDVGYQNLIVDDISVVVTDQFDEDSNTTIDVFTYTIDFKNRYTLAETSFADLELTRIWGFADYVSGAPAADTMHFVVYDATGLISGVRRQPLEIYDSVSTVAGAKLPDGTNNFFEDVIGVYNNEEKPGRSNYVCFKPSQSPTGFAYEQLVGGSDGAGEASVTLGAVAQGYDLYREADEIDISFVLQGKANNPSHANYIVANVAEYRKDCVATLSPRRTDVVDVSNPNVQNDNVLSWRSQVQNSSYFFMDSGYKKRYDKYNDVYRWVPLNGDMAGLMSRIDPWESPAGLKRGLIKNCVKLAFNPNKALRDLLYGQGVNPVITQTGFGTVLFGDKTGVGVVTAFDRINVRRLFITVEKAIASVSYSLLFDFNDEFTQALFKNMVEPFLRDIQGKRGIIDFKVVSDETVNTPDVIDRNMFSGFVFIKPSRTINQITLTFVATRTGVSFEETAGLVI